MMLVTSRCRHILDLDSRPKVSRHKIGLDLLARVIGFKKELDLSILLHNIYNCR